MEQTVYFQTKGRAGCFWADPAAFPPHCRPSLFVPDGLTPRGRANREAELPLATADNSLRRMSGLLGGFQLLEHLGVPPHLSTTESALLNL